jgi:hypothetical protein
MLSDSLDEDLSVYKNLTLKFRFTQNPLHLLQSLITNFHI